MVEHWRKFGGFFDSPYLIFSKQHNFGFFLISKDVLALLCNDIEGGVILLPFLFPLQCVSLGLVMGWMDDKYRYRHQRLR